MAVSAKYHLELTATETLALSLDNAANPDIVHKIDSSFGTIDADSTVPATKVFSDQITLSSGTSTLDLTGLSIATLDNVDMTGLKVQLFKVKAASTNSAVLTVADGATNGYSIFGDTSGQVSLDAGTEILVYVPDKLADVSSTVKTIDFTSSDVDAIYDVIIVAG